jgi:hypothetical protein
MGNNFWGLASSIDDLLVYRSAGSSAIKTPPQDRACQNALCSAVISGTMREKT